jgi:hypothetical protein
MNEIQENTEKNNWTRLLYMILFAILFNISEFVIYIVMIIQFLLKLMTGQANKRLIILGQDLARYVAQLVEYLTFVSDKKPYPFSPWPCNKNSQESEP